MDLVGAGFKPALRWPSAFLVAPKHAVLAPDQVHEIAILVTRVPARAGLKPAPTPFAEVAATTVNSNRSVLQAVGRRFEAEAPRNKPSSLRPPRPPPPLCPPPTRSDQAHT